MEQLLGVQVAGTGPDAGYVRCPLHVVCGWQVVDRTHLGWIVLVDTEASQRSGDLRTRHVDAVEHVNTELAEHLATEHLEHLQRLLSAASGGRGDLSVVTSTVVLSRELVEHAPEGAPVAHAVEQLRRQLQRELALRNLRPLDPWPAVTVRRLAWSNALEQQDGLPHGMRELHPDDPQPPDLYHLELRTLAQPDTRAVVL
jgi:hypothetical protein